MTFKTICAVTDVPVDAMKSFELEGESILVIHLDDGFHATQAKCPHLFMPLQKGKLLEGGRVQCKFHRAEFDVRSGDACRWANFPPGIQVLNVIRKEQSLKTYVTQVENDQVMVDI